VQEKYLRGVLGMDRETPGYIGREECKRNRLKVKAGNRKRRKGRLQEKKEKEHGEREILSEKRVYQ
jgi:hypothetical protein